VVEWRQVSQQRRLPDLYFTSNVGPNRLYLNKGIIGSRTSPKERVADPDAGRPRHHGHINGDGLRRYLRVRRDFLTKHGHNVLYINNGDGTFTDRTKEYGLATPA